MDYKEQIEQLNKKLCCKSTKFYNSLLDFPVVGKSNVLYVDKSTGSIYTWDSTEEEYVTKEYLSVPYINAIQDVDLGEFGIKTGNIEFDTTPTNTPTEEGGLYWNDQDGTLDLKLKGGNVTLQIGQEEVIRVVNKTGSNLLESEYKTCRIRTTAEGGAQGQRLAVKLAQADSKANHSGLLGLVTENIDNNEEGFITTFGKVRNINTTGTLQGESWTDGDKLFLSTTTPGQLTNIEPTQHPVQIGYVVYSHANNGIIFVKVDDGVDELSVLHDVDITSPITDGSLLQYNTTSSTWKNSSLNTVTGAVLTSRKTESHTLQISDVGKLIETNVGTPNDLIVPLHSSVQFPTGTKIDIIQYGTGQTTILPISGVTIRSINNWTKISSQYGVVSLIKIGENEWYLTGNLSA